MPRAEKRFSLFCVDEEGLTTYLILDDGEREPVLSNWVSCKSIRKVSAGKEYGSRLVFYLNYINSIGIEYPDADNEVVKKFINYVIYGGRDGANTVSMIPLVTETKNIRYVLRITHIILIKNTTIRGYRHEIGLPKILLRPLCAVHSYLETEWRQYRSGITFYTY